MSKLTEEQVVDKIEIVGVYFHVQVRTATVIKRDGIEISHALHRHVIAPGDDYSKEVAHVQKICSVLHTENVVAAYKAQVAAAMSGDAESVDDV